MHELREEQGNATLILEPTSNLPVPVAIDRSRQRAATAASTPAASLVPAVVFAFAALAAVPGGVGNPGGGLAVLAVSLLGALIVDLVLWQEREAACAGSQGAHA